MVKSGKNWSLCKLGAICDFIGGSQPPKGDFIYEPKNDYIRLIQIRDYKSDKHLTFIPRASAKRFCSKEDVMIGRYGPPLFQILRGIEGAYNVALIKAMPKSPEIIDKDFLFFRLQDSTLRNFIITVSERTVGQDGVRKDLLEDYEIFLPPLNEQRRIVAKLEVLLGKVDACQKRLEKIPRILKRFRLTVLAAVFRGDLTKEWREKNKALEPASVLLERIRAERRRFWEETELAKLCSKEHKKTMAGDWKAHYKEPEPVTTKDLPELSEEWAWASLEQVLIMLRNGIGIKPTGEPESGIPMLRISALRPMSVNLDDFRYLSKDYKGYEDYILVAGDLLFTRYNGNSSLVGVCGLVRNIDKEIVHPDKLIRGKVVPNLCLPEFLEIVLNTGITRKIIASRGKTSAGQTGISGSDLRTVPVPIPPLLEQQEIVRRVESLFKLADQLEARYQKAKAHVDKLTQSILAKAFRGELVPQDPSDEPASALLEHIQKEKSLGENVRTTKARKPNVKAKPADKEVLENERPVSEINEISIKKVEEGKIAQSVDNALVEAEKLGEQLCLPFMGAED